MAISDVLSEAIEEIRSYLKDDPCYAEPNFQTRCKKLVADMEAMRIDLDTPPKQ
jgi:hypothetical protein